MPEPSDFRNAMRFYPTGVTVVTSMHKGKPRGITVNSFTSVSTNPPMAMICVNREARSYLYIAASKAFCVNMLSLEQRALAQRFSRGMSDQQFDDVPHRLGETGSPILGGTVGFFECIVESEHHAGTHSIFVGNVVALHYLKRAPLGYYDGEYRDFGLP